MYDCSIQHAASTHKFTAKERDSESGLDNFGARYNTSSMGRFMSPDWSMSLSGVPYASFVDPQSLNLYAYVGNNPLNRIDVDGHRHQVCDQDTFSSDNGVYTLKAGPCHDVADWWDFQRTRNWFRSGWSSAAQLGVVIRTASARTLRIIWLRANPGQLWPKTPAGRNFDVHHKDALADKGAERDPNNLEPKESGEHNEYHRENGDFARWASEDPVPPSGNDGLPSAQPSEPSPPSPGPQLDQFGMPSIPGEPIEFPTELPTEFPLS